MTADLALVHSEEKQLILPHNLEAEQGVLGILLQDNAIFDEISEILSPEHFYHPVHSRLYSGITSLIEQGKTAGPIALKAYFKDEEELKHVGGADYLTDLVGAVIWSGNAPHYAQIVADNYLRRELIIKCRETEAQAFENSLERLDAGVSTLIEDHEAGLYALAEDGLSQTQDYAFKDSMMEALIMAEKAYNNKGEVSGVSTGLKDLDVLLGGLQPTDLLILAGRPSMGKTSLATNIAFNAAHQYLQHNEGQGASVGMFSLEMGHAQLAGRILADRAQVPSDAVRKGQITREQFIKLNETSRILNNLPLHIDDTTNMTISALRTRARRMKRKHNIGLLIVDYLQLLHGSNSRRANDNRTQEVAEITRGLKAIAKDLNIPVLALSQLSRAVEQREDKRPMLSDLRESGSIEQDADAVMFIYREEYYLERQKPSEISDDYQSKLDAWEQKMEAAKNITEVIVAKQRHGPVGTAKLRFDSDFTRFEDLQIL